MLSTKSLLNSEYLIVKQNTVKPLVSIIIPCYNGEKFIDTCLSSIQNQNYSKLEIIVVDNMSTDRTEAIVNAYAEADKRIKLVKSPIPGLAATKNVGIASCTGDWIMEVDADDFLADNAVELLLNIALEKECPLVCGTYYICDDAFGKLNQIHLKYIDSADREKIHNYFLTEGRDFCQSWGKLYRKDIIENVRYPEGRIYEDISVIPRIIENAERCVVVDIPIYYYLQHSSSISMSTPLSYQLDGLDARVDNCGFYRERYPKLLPVAYDSALEFVFFLMGKLYNSGIDENITMWDKLMESFKELSEKAGKKGLAMKGAVLLTKKSPRFAAKLFSIYSSEKNKTK